MPADILVINPNSTQSVTDGIARAVAPYAGQTCRFSCTTMTRGPAGVMTQRDADLAAMLVADHVAGDTVSAGFIVACYSDPGLIAAREVTDRPVVGIGEASIEAARAVGTRVGVIAVSSPGMARHWRLYRAMDVAHAIVGERAIDLTVAESGVAALALDKLIATGRALKNEDGADVLVMGCAGMSDLRGKLEEAVGIPVIDPCAAAAAAMVATLTRSGSQGKSA